MLEIYADDVKCSHGSTVGQLNEQALFYMQQRGISREEAQMLLKFAFAGEVIDAISLEAFARPPAPFGGEAFPWRAEPLFGMQTM